ncbi:MAG: hypothetical protein ABI577_07320 [bacterium]
MAVPISLDLRQPSVTFAGFDSLMQQGTYTIPTGEPMITERLSFRARYGQGDALVALMKENLKTMPPPASVVSARLYTDFTGPMFSVVLEIDHADLTAFAVNTRQETQDYGSKEFQDWFAKMVDSTESGERQLFNSEKVI